ncbi:DNA cytosine methyltransferase [Nostoc edaphicum CCNP1411]|uniref:Cytosine-specific methyltransferase n=1 Tax=Nostoc edaphicum CCNP1411 TaxID=1472755 RepID=A0A7D7QM59_9NOSO|nr:DNA cytosine methyltransferase [Nostoc edaphicum]QMS91341.1 DNA cytosine methyltransferase [Nostoc edaphicum CCNP1411]
MIKPACNPGSRVRYRANIKLSKEQDQELNSSLSSISEDTALHGALTASRNDVRVVELFAGAGGMGVGFLMASDKTKGFRIINSAEINPIFLKSLETNYKYFYDSINRVEDSIPSDFIPIDLTKKNDCQLVHEAVKKADGVDIVIGGTPCQGFSQSNRTNWNAKNTYNQLVEYFIECSLELAPKAILLENVQGILWTPRSNKSKNKHKLTVVDYIAKKFTDAGYVLFPTVLDAAWYGVPQHRNRFFLLALHKDLGYTVDHFGEWGAFPLPTHGAMGKHNYVTVKEAIADLPVVENGEGRVIQEYDEPTLGQLSSNPFLQQMRQMAIPGTIEGHIVSKQANYVIDRYRHIPAGGNWQNIRHMMTNYSDIENTHSNIYKRLKWDEPSITIGNYRKSMIIHPEQNRGLSLREASRLQSLPDWFTFCGNTDNSKTLGIMHKQQQLANTVSFLLTLKIAQYILKL